MKKILVANRGEIALRVMRSAKEMGLSVVAVYSEADRTSQHVLFADEAVCIGPAPSSQSYLKMEKIIEAAKATGADAIHPGYGFLSENALFAEAVEQAGLTFIGPRPHAIRMMGNKLAAKQAVKAYGIPLVPGTEEATSNAEEAMEYARKIGFPILIKAAAGGGGKGMRVVHHADDLEDQLKRAISEAQSAFGDGSVFIEKYIGSPRHVEIQIMADTHGNIIHLFERDCSIQRRHQKVIEEAPCPVMTESLRQRMGQSAVNVAKACGYTGAGTVEFLVDEKLNYYFLEMNTRLQVEHPVTELITGTDLVKWQIMVADGQKLPVHQEDLQIRGHAIELRVYAEDAANNFLPDSGHLYVYNKPEGAGIRVDDGYRQGMDVPIYYDPLLAKLCVWANDRNSAIDRMKRAIEEFEIAGVKTTLPFGYWVMSHPKFRAGDFDTHFIENYFNPDELYQLQEDHFKAASVISTWIFENELRKPEVESAGQPANNSLSRWKLSRKQT